MPTFRVFYARPEHFRDTLVNPENVTRKSAPDTHVSVGVIHAKDHDEAFQMMQAENMTPEQVNAAVAASGRTSMSVGDVLYRQDGTMFVCQSIGWITHDPIEPIYPPTDGHDA